MPPPEATQVSSNLNISGLAISIFLDWAMLLIMLLQSNLSLVWSGGISPCSEKGTQILSVYPFVCKYHTYIYGAVNRKSLIHDSSTLLRTLALTFKLWNGSTTATVDVDLVPRKGHANEDKKQVSPHSLLRGGYAPQILSITFSSI
jgi:hypothetical protein